MHQEFQYSGEVGSLTRFFLLELRGNWEGQRILVLLYLSLAAEQDSSFGDPRLELVNWEVRLNLADPVICN